MVCPLCMTEKDLDSFGNDRSRPNGRFPYCRDCQRARQRTLYAKKAPAVDPAKTAEYIVRHIDFTAEPDGIGGFHHRYLGRGVNTAKSVPLIQRLSVIADGHELPTPISRWCEDEFPWCVNLDHITSHGELPKVDYQEFAEENGEQAQGFQWVLADEGETLARAMARLDGLHGDWNLVAADVEKVANNILRRAGYNTNGQPYKRSNPRKGRIKKVA